jgi:hypothetical protein
MLMAAWLHLLVAVMCSGLLRVVRWSYFLN